ncbi:unnamed protein product, partial [Timema podura]|nr:unnamed protein product [Timema podura]
VFTNKCAAKGCRIKEVVKVLCPECKLNFCLKHRHTTDHQCEGAAGAARRRTAFYSLQISLPSCVPRDLNNLVEVGFKPSENQARCRRKTGDWSGPKPTSLKQVLASWLTSLVGAGSERGEAAMARLKSKSSESANQVPQLNVVGVQGTMSEDEALARALALSMESSSLESQTHLDMILAQSISQSEQQQRSSAARRCALS